MIASITAFVALHVPAAHAAPQPTGASSCAAVTSILARASNGLLMPSETDVAFTPFTWTNGAKRRLTTARLLRLSGHAPGTPVEVVGLAHFFRNVAFPQSWHDPQQAANVRRFQRLMRVLQRHFDDVRVYRVGTIRIDAYIVGRCGRDLTGLSTVLVET